MTTYRRIGVENDEGVTVVTFVGRKILEAKQICELREELLSLVDCDGYIQIVLDFTGLEFLTNVLLNTLIIFDKKIKAKAGQLKMCNMLPGIHEVFVITRLNQLFEIVDTREEALKAFAR